MCNISLSEVGAYERQGFKVIPQNIEINADTHTPISILSRLREISSNAYMLESASGNGARGRYTFLGYDPALEIRALNGTLSVKNLRDSAVSILPEDIEVVTDNPGTYVREMLEGLQAPIIEGMPRFAGGLVGFFSYDFVRYAEPTLGKGSCDDAEFDDMDVMFFDKVIAFDNYTQRLYLIANMSTDNIMVNYSRARIAINEMQSIISTATAADIPTGKLTTPLTPEVNRLQYCEMVERAKNYIREGDIFQVVLSNRLSGGFEGSLMGAYRTMRRENPSPYMFYFSSDTVEVAGASPETLIKLDAGKLQTFPLAGTRPRGLNNEEDGALEAELLADEKELSEHNMLVDLGRNDLGRISKPGSVSVDEYLRVLKFNHVMHLGSTVSSQISDGLGPMDALSSVLPAGTLSGAPKVRACQIIDELEHSRRGIYGGAVGYIDLTGNMDCCIAIRLAYRRGDTVYVRSGAGIVADSVAESEYEECINKAASVVEALVADEGSVS